MSRVLAFAPVAVAATLLAAAAQAQPTPLVPDGPVTTSPAPAPGPLAPVAPVAMTPLAAPDAFSTPGRATGLPPTLWSGSSPAVVKAVLPLLAEKPLSPAAAVLARRVLATGAPGPAGVGNDAGVIAARAAALTAQGDPGAAAAILASAPGLDRSPDLARAAAESALLSGQDARACQIESQLSSGRDDIYWVRLRTYCQAIAGKTAEAQLTFDLAQSQAKDPAFTRLMAAKLAGSGNPGAPSLRNGLDYALSRSLGLDLGGAKPSPAVAAVLANAAPGDAAIDPAGVAPDLAGVAQSIAAAGSITTADLDRLLDAADVHDPKARARAAAAALLAAPFAREFTSTQRARIAALSVAEGKAPIGRNLALENATGRAGEAAMLALWTCAEAGPAGLTVGDRVRIVAALRANRLESDARAFALEGLAALK